MLVVPRLKRNRFAANDPSICMAGYAPAPTARSCAADTLAVSTPASSISTSFGEPDTAARTLHILASPEPADLPAAASDPFLNAGGLSVGSADRTSSGVLADAQVACDADREKRLEIGPQPGTSL